MFKIKLVINWEREIERQRKGGQNYLTCKNALERNIKERES